MKPQACSTIVSMPFPRSVNRERKGERFSFSNSGSKSFCIRYYSL